MNSTTNWKRLLAFALVGLAIGGGVAAYFVYFRNTPVKSLNAATASYREGAAALQDGDPATAARKLDEAVLQASRAIDLLEKENLTTKGDTPEVFAKRQTMLGQAYWIKGIGIRDKVFAEAKADGKPLSETVDTTMDTTFRSIFAIKQKEPLEEALRCYRVAAHYLPGELDVQREALRTEVMMSPPNWSLVEKFCENIIAKEGGDTRANHQLAQFHYEQPVIDAKGRQGPPLPLAKRSASRMLKARGYLDAVKKSPDHKFWRTRDLETQVALWLRDDYSRQGKTDKFTEEDQRIRRLLTDPKEGVLAKAAADPKMAEHAVFDLKAAFHLYRLAVKESIRDRKDAAAATEQIVPLVDAALDLAVKASKGKESRVRPTSIKGALEVLQEARPFLPSAEAKVAIVRDLAKETIEAKEADMDMFAQMVRFLQMDARFTAKSLDEKARQSREKEIDQWITDGLAFGRERKMPDVQLLDLTAISAERKTLKGETPTDELAFLRKLKIPQATQLAAFLEGVAHERAGRLERARTSFLESDPEGQSLRTNLALGQVYLALGQSDQALQRLQRVAAAYTDIEDSPDRDWIAEFLPSKEELSYLTVVARLGAARQRVVEHRRANPGKAIPVELIGPAEKDARALIAKLPERNRFRERSRQALIRHHIQLGRAKEAREELGLARKEQDFNVELLQMEIGVLALEAGGDSDAAKKKVDEHLQGFLKSNPADTSGKLLWSMWLLRTGRAEEAAKYLESPAFAGAKDERQQRILALALLESGQREAGVKLLQHLPSSPDVDALLVRLTKDETQRAELLAKATARHERNGMLRVLNAGELLGKSKWPEAAKEFFQALEYAQVRSAAEKGLLQSLFAFGEQKPVEARKAIEGMLAETPTEKSLYLAFAYTALQLDDLGEPTDAWERSKNLATALNVWEQLQRKGGGDATAISLTKAEFWLRAGRPDQAQAEIRKVYDPKNATIVEIMVRLALEGTSPALRDERRKQLAVLRELRPDSAEVDLYEARLLLLEKKGKEAIAHLEKAQTRHPKSRVFPAMLFNELMRTGELDQASTCVADWEKRFPEDSEAMLADVTLKATRKNFDGALKAAAEYVADQRAQADKLIKSKEIAKDSDKILANVDLNSGWQLARAYLRAKALKESESQVRDLLAKRADFEPALLLQGEIEMARKDWKAAAQAYEQILKKNPQHFVAGNNLAYILSEHLGEADRALTLVEPLRRGRFSSEPLSGDRLRLDFLDTIGAAYLKAKADVHADMKKLFEQARRRYPLDPRLCVYLAHAQANLGDFKGAQASLAAGIALAESAHHGLSVPERDHVLALAQAARKNLEKAPAP